MNISGNEIFDIIKNIEKEKGLPKGLLTEIYDQELDREHLGNRTSYKAADGVLRDTIMRYFED